MTLRFVTAEECGADEISQAEAVSAPRGQPLASGPTRCVNAECPLSSFDPDPSFGSEPENTTDKETN